jgi:hypothetical protein
MLAAPSASVRLRQNGVTEVRQTDGDATPLAPLFPYCCGPRCAGHSLVLMRIRRRLRIGNARGQRHAGVVSLVAVWLRQLPLGGFALATRGCESAPKSAFGDEPADLEVRFGSIPLKNSAPNRHCPAIHQDFGA